MKFPILLFLLVSSHSVWSSVVAQGSHQYLQGRYDNGYSEQRFLLVTESFERFFAPHFQTLGARFFLDTDWGDGAVNAWAWHEGDRYSLEVPGGIARYHTMSEEAFVMTLCHELGHLLGGAPSTASRISFEGQSDYFATTKCFGPFSQYIQQNLAGFQSGGARTVFSEEQNFIAYCKDHKSPEVCYQALLGALGTSAYFAELERSQTPRLATRDLSVVRSTITKHPKAQCRFDTMVAGVFCQADSSVMPSWTDPIVGFCHQGFERAHARPACWYRAP